jgi:hypothetical protein
MSVESQCDRNSCNHEHSCNHTHDNTDLEYLQEVIIRGELLRDEYETQLKEGKLHLRKVKWERWVASQSCNTCPICRTLHQLSWQIQGTFFKYSWDGQSKEVLMPRYRQAHSEIGEGRWNAPDSSCRCKKESFSTDSNNPVLPPPIPLPSC